MELVIVTPVLVLCAVFVFWGGRLGEARSLVDLAASRGARAASLVSRARMDSVGRAASVDALQNNGVSCASLGVAVSVMERYVRVTVRCVSNDSGVSPFGSRTLTASALAPIDYYRAG
jgi:Flp pilus assembly protein TadG